MAGQIDINTLQALTAGRRGTGTNRLKFFSDLFPYLLVPVLVYNFAALFADGGAPDGVPALRAVMDAPGMIVPMLSGVGLEVTWGDLLVIFATIFLFVEVVKSTSTSHTAIINHILSMVLFVFCLIEFLLFASFATGTFFILTCMVLVDALAGMVVSIMSARRDFGVEGMN